MPLPHRAGQPVQRVCTIFIHVKKIKLNKRSMENMSKKETKKASKKKDEKESK